MLSLFAPELLDCARCEDGCAGGYIWDAFITVLNYSEYLALLDNYRGGGHPGSKAPALSPGGLASEKDYPFRGHANIHKCLASNYRKVAWIYDYIMLPRDEQGMASVGDMGGVGEETIGMGRGGAGAGRREGLLDAKRSSA